MKTVGIIAEYNPFHKGHALHVGQTVRRGASHIVAVMSSSFVQRGESAILSKFARAQSAISGGADLVIELPVVWSTANAQNFALGGVKILDSLGCVDAISFGSESGDVELLKESVRIIESERFSQRLKEQLEKGISFAKARENAVKEMGFDASAFESPNDTLGMEYIAALNRISSDIEPWAIKRVGASHDSTEHNVQAVSASYIRENIKNNFEIQDLIPDSTYSVIQSEEKLGRYPALFSKLETAVIASLRQKSVSEIKKAPDVSEGIENRIYSAVREGTSLEEIYALAKSKRYSHARVRRIILNSFLGIKSEDVLISPPYARVLAFNEKGREILRLAKKSSEFPIIMKTSQISELDETAKRIFELECRASDMFALTMPKPVRCGEDFFYKINIF